MKKKVIKFRLSGKSAIFTIPDINKEEYHFTYNHIHKVTLLGILGAIIGLEGYNLQYINKSEYPEFYRVLKDIKVSIIPSKPTFKIKEQVFTNTTGFGNKDGNEIIREKWLEEVEWNIYLMQGKIEENIWNKVYDYILNGQQIYSIYLGRRGHLAKIDDVEKIMENEIQEVEYADDIDNINSLFYYEILDEYDEPSDEDGYWLRESMPIGLDKETNLYINKTYVFTNYELEINNTNNLYKHNNNILYFF